MKKRIAIIVAVLVVVVCVFTLTVAQKKRVPENQEDFALHLDQNDTYISISSNDMNGYNRWLPFYFYLQMDGDKKPEDVEVFLNENFVSATILSNVHGELFTSTELVWSAFRLEPNHYNLSLVIIPGLDELLIDGQTEIDKIVLQLEDTTLEYSFENCIVEVRETIPEDDLYVALSTIETKIREDLTAIVQYGFFEQTPSIESIELDYPDNFSNMEKYEISVTSKEDNIIEYTAVIHFRNFNNKVVFRPFIRVNYNGQSGWAVPPLPAYIN